MWVPAGRLTPDFSLLTPPSRRYTPIPSSTLKVARISASTSSAPASASVIAKRQPICSAWAAVEKHPLGRDALGDHLGKPQPVDAGRRQHHGVKLPFGHFPQARVEIAAHVDCLEVPPQVLELRLAPQAGSADDGASGEVGEAGIVFRNQYVAR